MQQNRLPDFKERLNRLLGNKSITEFAKDLGLSRQTLGFYLNGDRIPDAETLAQICSRCHVSADYLLGLSEAQSPSVEIQAILDYTGLSEKAITYLHTLSSLTQIPPENKGYSRISLLSDLLCDHTFDLFLALCVRYIDLNSSIFDPVYSGSAEFTAFTDSLKEHGYAVIPAGDQATVLFSERITNLLKTVIDSIAEKHLEANIAMIQGGDTHGQT